MPLRVSLPLMGCGVEMASGMSCRIVVLGMMVESCVVGSGW